METTELRIGNIVNAYKVGVCRVDGIESDILISTANDEYIPINDVEGIPINEQWLLDFGFKICTKSGVHNGWGIGENPLTHDYLLFLVWMKNEDGTLAELFYRNGYHTIKYVHQLQNLYFALTQEELILKERSEG